METIRIKLIKLLIEDIINNPLLNYNDFEGFLIKKLNETFKFETKVEILDNNPNIICGNVLFESENSDKLFVNFTIENDN